MNRVFSWRAPLWMVVVLMACTLALSTGIGYALALGTSAAAASQTPSGECTESAEVCERFANFWRVWNIAEEEFLDPDAIQPEEMVDGAINGMLDTLNDRGHTRYADAEDFQRQQESLEGQFKGIGAYISQEGALPTITAPIEGSPAEAAGIKAGDVILEVDGVSTEGLSIDEVVNRVRGEPGTSVTLKILHAGEEAPVDITITRAEITVPAVTWRMLPGNVAHIRLSQFSEKATADIKQALAEAKAQGAQKLILDVRNNPGGLLEQAIGVTSQFLPEGATVLRIRDRDGNEEVRRANEPNPETELPMVVLINGGSASSSEIFAGALQDHNRAEVVGVQTVGLGTVVTPIPLPDGSAVFLGTAEWLTPGNEEYPEGRPLRHEGVVPDITEALPPGVTPLTPTTAKDLSDQEILQTEDTQIKRALELLGVTTTSEGPAGVAFR